jgi:hypothetical protein
LPGGHLVQQQPQRELVGPEIHRQAARLLWTHVGNSPGKQPRLGDGLVFEGGRDLRRRLKTCRPHETEIEDLRAPGARDHDVFRFQIAMDDAGGVRFSQAVGDLRRQIEEAFERHRAAPDFLAQRLAVDQFRDDVGG